MTHPRERLDADARRKQFEDAAIYLVSHDGFRAVTTDAIARQAGVSKGLLWRYYANLDELMQRAGERALRDLEKTIAKDLDLAQPVPALLKETIRRAAHLPEQHHAELLAIQRIVNNLQLPDGSRAFTEANSYHNLYANQVIIFARGQKEASIRPDLDTQLLARIYQGAVDAMIDHLMHDPTLDPEPYAENLIKILLDGVAT